ncbi:MAG: MerR family transcriptional regulator [Alphaproteobacteria bacterium]|nr:MerR family transcriptional regulator [Alphaproteobacteria bacterium]
MKIGEVAKKTGLTEHTLRFYEKAGLMPDVAKRAGGVRDYGPADITRLGMIECLKQTGMSLADIKIFIDWCALGDKTIQQRHNMFIERKNAVKKQMAEIKKTLKIIDFKIDYYARALDAGTLKIYEKNPPKLPDYFAK